MGKHPFKVNNKATIKISKGISGLLHPRLRALQQSLVPFNHGWKDLNVWESPEYTTDICCHSHWTLNICLTTEIYAQSQLWKLWIYLWKWFKANSNVIDVKLVPLLVLWASFRHWSSGLTRNHPEIIYRKPALKNFLKFTRKIPTVES